jgi:predicted solute-binding protein
MPSAKTHSKGNSKVYGFSAEPTAFNPVIEKIDKIAIDKHTSRSEVITDILLNHFGMENSRSLRKMDYSDTIMRKIKT